MNNQGANLVFRVKNYIYKSEDLLGKGAAGKVYKGINQLNGQQVAIKVMEMSSIDNEVTRFLLACQQEALLTIKNQYVLQAYDIIQTPQQCLIVTPLCSGGTLKSYITSKGKLPEIQALQILLKLLNGCLEIRNKGFVHRDLKSINVMFRNNEPVIIDFGYCQKVNAKKPKMFYNVGSPSYMSPEAYYKSLYSQKSDIWALGIVLFQMLQGFTIDHGQQIDKYFSALCKQGFAMRSKVSDSTKHLLRSILNPNFQQRPSIQQIIHITQKIIHFQLRNSTIEQHTNQQNSKKISLKQKRTKTQPSQIATQQIKVNQNIQNKAEPQQNAHAQQTQIIPQKNNNNNRIEHQNNAQHMNQNMIKMSQSIYKPVKVNQSHPKIQVTQNHHMPAREVIVNINGVNHIHQMYPQQVKRPQLQHLNNNFINFNNFQAHKVPNFQNPHQQLFPDQSKFFPQNQFMMQGQFPQQIPQQFPQHQQKVFSQNQFHQQQHQNQFIQSHTTKQMTQYRSFIQNSTHQSFIADSQHTLQVPMKANSEALLLNDAQSVLTIQQMSNGKTLTNSSHSQNRQQINQSLNFGNNYTFLPKPNNPVVQSMIVQPQYQFTRNQTKQSYINQSLKQNPNVHNSLIFPPHYSNQQHPNLVPGMNHHPNNIHNIPNIPNIPHVSNGQQNQFYNVNNLPQFKIDPQMKMNTNRNSLNLKHTQRASRQMHPNIGFNTNRPQSPIATQRLSMGFNPVQNESKRNFDIGPQKNFFKKTAPYFHMSTNQNHQMPTHHQHHPNRQIKRPPTNVLHPQQQLIHPSFQHPPQTFNQKIFNQIPSNQQPQPINLHRNAPQMFRNKFYNPKNKQLYGVFY